MLGGLTGPLGAAAVDIGLGALRAGGTPPVGDMEGRPDGRDGFPLPGGTKRTLAENPNVPPGGLDGGDGWGIPMGNEGGGG